MILYIILITNAYVITKSEPIGVTSAAASTIADKTTAHNLMRNFSNNVLTTTKPKQSGLHLTDRQTRRILAGRLVGDTRPYMVYLRPAVTKETAADIDEDNWLCGGVIIHERYVLTSAACIENAMHFYVVSGTHKWHSGTAQNVDCINNGAKKAIWKCVPKSYVYDGNEFDNIRWMVNDIAVVKVEDEFNFEKRIKGCDFVPQKVAYNNMTPDYEKPNTIASIAGWGSTEFFSDLAKMSRNTFVTTEEPGEKDDDDNDDDNNEQRAKGGSRNRASPKAQFRASEPTSETMNSPDLLETEVVLLSKRACKKRWPERYYYIIDRYVICGKDSTDAESMSKACAEHEVNCKELVYSQESDESERRSGKYYYLSRRTMAKAGKKSGGFCENDHGGPLVVGYGKTSIIIGVISACLTTEITNKCHGPFLYTSVYNNRHLISCAIDKETEATCKKLLRTLQTRMQETNFVWTNHPHGPAKSEIDDEDNDDNTRKQVENKPALNADDDVPFRSMQARPNQDSISDPKAVVTTQSQSPAQDLVPTDTTTSAQEITIDDIVLPSFPEDDVNKY